MYADILEGYLDGSMSLQMADREAKEITPEFHTPTFVENMKKRLYTKNPEHYKQWADLGESLRNIYWSPSEKRFIEYENGKRIC